MAIKEHCWPVVVVLGAAVSGCGGNTADGSGDRTGGSGSNSGPGATGSGTVDGTCWEDYCTATFTSDYDVVDFGDVVLSAKTGETYLLVDFSDLTSDATLVYLTDDGPAEFSVSPDPSTGELPLTSNCDPTAVAYYYGAFTDVVVYEDVDLTSELCTLEACTAEPVAAGPRGYAATDFALSGPSTYEVYLDAFSPSCGNAEVGYVSVPETVALGATTWLVPIIGLLGPG